MNYPDNFVLSDYLSVDWVNAIDKSILLETEKKLNDTIQECKTLSKNIYPSPDRLFYVFNKCKIDNIKVVILGQDPYHRFEYEANGMAFSVNNGVTTPPSLRNIIKELKSCYPESLIENDLSSWVNQGVFLLNTSLTVQQNFPGSHMSIWNKFIIHIIELIQKRQNIIFCLWGKYAEKIQEYIIEDNIVFKSSHPSPFSALKTNNPFIGSRIFSNINKTLEKIQKTQINW